ncbi:DegT/DnrJ/EryC1/StrS family aminotransferase [Aliarcobacter cryaerophilus]|uniref:DegT/DnrJ/EryC1/StrS family aminotransferase n=1 Tax=Aliarcobacter cryaerophilus TaxID=28198 RepID=UPI0021B4BFDF|nr:DegT/DnrJ/EryC1/StrS family aminotransferase [Aliarcobacter cryaerophilus]MCT7522605.1 DegT/DnrJ/EryC1/StrS family aminotransferase [Aliarcobacter cryaerophilus]
MWKIPLFDLDYGDDEKKAVIEVLENKWLSSGEKTKKFEQEFSKYLGNDILSTAVSSATAALHISLMIAGVKINDEVVISGLTFVADANVVTLCGATPIFADVNSLGNWNPNVKDIKSKVTPKTKAIIVVHFAGYPIEDIDELVRFCKERNILLIEDVAHAVGASYNGQKCGTFGDIGCFSFFSNKNLSTGEGGMFVTKNSEFDKQARLLRSHGMTSMTIDRHEGKTISYDVIQAGLNYRMDEIRCALGLVQLAKLDSNNNKRKELVEYYIKQINELIPNITIPFTNLSIESISSYHIFPIFLPLKSDRINIMEKLKKRGIQTSIHYPSFKNFTFYSRFYKKTLLNVEVISERILTLPLYVNLTKEMIDEIVIELKEILEK